MRKILEQRLENAKNDYGKTTREPQLELKGQIEAYQDCLNLLQQARTEQENEKLKKKINILNKCIPYYNYKALHADGKITDEELEILENN